jgi:aryl-alcohol dehydrogenase-like predicted oxidoreductase
MSLPANQRKLEVVGRLQTVAEEAGLSMIELAVGFVLTHPGITSAIIGPRTMEQLETFLPTADVVLSTEVLDRIDEVTVPGETINPKDTSYGECELAPGARRR